MRQEPESQLGVVAGLIALVMVMALSAMAFSALQPPHPTPDVATSASHQSR